MLSWIALLRGINVGGKNMLPMAQLKRTLEKLKLQNVQTYIQSGNVVFSTVEKTTAVALEGSLAAAIQEQHDLDIQVIVLSSQHWIDAIQSNPFAEEAAADPKSVHFFFLAKQPDKASVAALDSVRSQSERTKLSGKVFYLYAPDGVARSKLAASVEKRLGVATTARNYRTVEKLRSMID